MKKILLLIVTAVVLLVGAYLLYHNLSESNQAGQLATLPQGNPTEATQKVEPTQSGQATENTASSASTENSENAENTETQAKPQIQAPDFTVYDAAGNPVKLHDFVGKPIVLNFWASWCGPCRSEMPEFQEVFDELGSEVTFLMVNAGGETAKDAETFLQQAGYTFPVYYDLANGASVAYNVTGLPTTYFLNAQGDVVTYAVGAISKATLMKGIGMIQ